MQQAESSTPMSFPVWDFEVIDGICPFITGENADAQAAAIGSFLNKNSIPQLPGIGVPWTDFLVGNTEFAQVDTTIRYNINTAGLPYKPVYSVVNGRLKVEVVPS